MLAAALPAAAAAAGSTTIDVKLGLVGPNPLCVFGGECAEPGTFAAAEVGQRLLGGLSVTAFYASLGEHTRARATGPYDLKPTAFGLGAAYEHTFSERFAAAVRLGAAQVTTKATPQASAQAGSQPSREREVRPTAGVQLAWRTRSDLGVLLGFDTWQIPNQGERMTFRSLSAGLRLAF